MSEAIKNRYDFMVLFDVEMVILMVIRMLVICHVLMRKLAMGLLQTYV